MNSKGIKTAWQPQGLDDHAAIAPVRILQLPSPVAPFTNVVSFSFFFFALLLFLPKLMRFDLVENTFVSDTLLVPPVFGFILTSAHVVLLVVRVHEWLMDL